MTNTSLAKIGEQLAEAAAKITDLDQIVKTVVNTKLADLEQSIKTSLTDSDNWRKTQQVEFSKSFDDQRKNTWEDLTKRINQYWSFGLICLSIIGMTLTGVCGLAVYFIGFADLSDILQKKSKMEEKILSLLDPQGSGGKKILDFLQNGASSSQIIDARIKQYLDTHVVIWIPSQFTLKYSATSAPPQHVQFFKAENGAAYFSCSFSYSASEARPTILIRINDLDGNWDTIAPIDENNLVLRTFSIKEPSSKLFHAHYAGSTVWHQANFYVKNDAGATGSIGVNCEIMHVGAASLEILPGAL